jgi:hypothetical protein
MSPPHKDCIYQSGHMHIRLSSCPSSHRHLFRFTIGERIRSGALDGLILEGFLDGEDEQHHRITYRVQTTDGLLTIQEERLIQSDAPV